MIPRPIREGEPDRWTAEHGGQAIPMSIGGPEEGDDVRPCPALVNRQAGVVHVAYQLNELEVAALAQGGTVWLTTYGMVPVHRMAVLNRDGDEVPSE